MNIETYPNISYGILLSGGLDSAILLYLLVSNNPNIQLQPFTIDKTDGAALYADPVIDYMNLKFGLSIPNTIIVGNPEMPHRLQSRTAVLEIFAKYKIDKLYIGINRNPPELNSLVGAPRRNTRSTNPRIVFPFAHMCKDQILSLLFKHNLEDLMKITHSCTEQEFGCCNICWQCQERIWAFKQLGKRDYGQPTTILDNVLNYLKRIFHNHI